MVLLSAGPIGERVRLIASPLESGRLAVGIIRER